MANANNYQKQKENEPDIEPSETGNKGEKQTGDPGRTPGKAEGEDDSSATVGGQKQQDVNNFEQIKDKRRAETATPSDKNSF